MARPQREPVLAAWSRYRTDITGGAGDLLLADAANPRSVRFQLDSLALDLHDLPDRPACRAQLAAVRSAQSTASMARGLPLGSGGGHDGPGAGPGALETGGPPAVLEVGDLDAARVVHRAAEGYGDRSRAGTTALPRHRHRTVYRRIVARATHRTTYATTRVAHIACLTRGRSPTRTSTSATSRRARAHSSRTHVDGFGNTVTYRRARRPTTT